uniref:Uncharacterized protein n=1 Tax=Haemonchus contortus TaxID=6289 RepID=A0A7I4XWN9_HAECO
MRRRPYGCFHTSTTHPTVHPIRPSDACMLRRWRLTVADNSRSRASAVNTTLATAVAARTRRTDGRGRSSKSESGLSERVTAAGTNQYRKSRMTAVTRLDRTAVALCRSHPTSKCTAVSNCEQVKV